MSFYGKCESFTYLLFIRLCGFCALSQSIPGCHSLLVGPIGSGRKTLARLAATAMDAQIFELGYNSLLENKSLKSTLRDVCMSSGLEKRTVVLLIDSYYVMETDQWHSLLQLMNEGKCFMHSESSCEKNDVKQIHLQEPD